MAQLSRNILIPPRLVAYNGKIYNISGYGKAEDGKYMAVPVGISTSLVMIPAKLARRKVA